MSTREENGGGGVSLKWISTILGTLAVLSLAGYVRTVEARGELQVQLAQEQAVLRARVDAIERTGADTNARVIAMQAVQEREAQAREQREERERARAGR